MKAEIKAMGTALAIAKGNQEYAIVKRTEIEAKLNELKAGVADAEQERWALLQARDEWKGKFELVCDWHISIVSIVRSYRASKITTRCMRRASKSSPRSPSWRAPSPI